MSLILHTCIFNSARTAHWQKNLVILPPFLSLPPSLLPFTIVVQDGHHGSGDVSQLCSRELATDTDKEYEILHLLQSDVVIGDGELDAALGDVGREHQDLVDGPQSGLEGWRREGGYEERKDRGREGGV